MRPLAFIVLLALQAAALAAEVPPANPAPDTARLEIDNRVTGLIESFSDGSAVGYREFRTIAYGRLFGAAADDAVAMFSLEGFGGGNDVRQYLAFFAAPDPTEAVPGNARRYRLVAVRQVGGKYWRSFDGKTLKLDRRGVAVRGMAWSKDDPGCCPSLPTATVFAYDKGLIVEKKR